MKRLLALAGTLMLCACGGQDTRTPVSLSTLVVPNHAPWLILAPGPEDVGVRGLDQKVRILPDPPMAKALEAQLRAAVQQDYFTNLTIACERLQAEMRVDQDAAPDTLTLDLSLRCTFNARGAISRHDYSARPDATVKAGSSDAAYAAAFAVLLRQAGAQIAAHMSDDIRAARPGA